MLEVGCHRSHAWYNRAPLDIQFELKVEGSGLGKEKP
jgi:hypothetical protein